ALPGHLLGAVQRGELDELRVPVRLEPLEDVGERNAAPRHHHRPRLDAAQPIHAILGGEAPDRVLECIGTGLVALTRDLDRPWIDGHAPGVALRIALVETELVEVVVAGDDLLRRHLLARNAPVGALSRARFLTER